MVMRGGQFCGSAGPAKLEKKKKKKNKKIFEREEREKKKEGNNHIIMLRPALLRQSLRRCSSRWLSSANASSMVHEGDLNDGGQVRRGQHAKLRRAFSQEDVLAFARLTGDFNAIHVDEEAAREAGFAAPICHGMLHSSLIGTLFATCVPGAIYVSQDLKFKRPVFVGDTVEANIKVESIGRRGMCTCETTILLCKTGKVAMEGKAVVKAPTTEDT